MKKLAKEDKLEEVPEDYRDQAKKWLDNLRDSQIQEEPEYKEFTKEIEK